MTESAAAAGQSETDATTDTEPGPGVSAPVTDHLTERVLERVDDLARVIARQAGTIERLVDEAKARAQRERAGADLPLVVELFALYGDARTLADTAGSETERAAFETFAGGWSGCSPGAVGGWWRPNPGRCSTR